MVGFATENVIPIQVQGFLRTLAHTGCVLRPQCFNRNQRGQDIIQSPRLPYYWIHEAFNDIEHARRKAAEHQETGDFSSNQASRTHTAYMTAMQVNSELRGGVEQHPPVPSRRKDPR
eukprot:4477467-Heterocapsa_arctica.AAC.1